MKTRSFVTVALAAVLAASASALATGKPGGVTIGQPVADFKLPDADGKDHSLSTLKGEKGTVIIFISVQCPMVRAYNERIAKLAEDYRARGVNVVGINSNVKELAPEVKSHAAEKGLKFTILKDTGNVVADSFDAQVTPEAYLIDASGKLVYRGRIDNSRNADGVSASELRDAIEATLAGKPVEKSEVKAFGCSIKRVS